MRSRPLIFVHGLGSSFEKDWVATGWTAVFEANGHACQGVSLPGHGGLSSSLNSTEALRSQLGVDKSGPVDAIGFSAGARALMMAAAEEPGLFRRLVLLGLGDSFFRSTGADFAALADALESGDMSDPIARSIAFGVRAAQNDVNEVADYVRRYRNAPEWAALENVRVPVLLVLGGDDPVGPADRLLAALPCAVLVGVAGIGHVETLRSFAALDAAERFLSGTESCSK